jgi:hypothetical protein
MAEIKTATEQKLPAGKPVKRVRPLTDPVTVPDDFKRPVKKLPDPTQVVSRELLSGPEIQQLKKNYGRSVKRYNILLKTFRDWHHHVKSNPNTCACGRNPCSQLKAIDEAEAV